MKSILMSIRSEWVAKILNGIKKKEVRSKFPKDFVGWVYIYCTKGKPNLYRHFKGEFFHSKETNTSCLWNGKVVARFWCDKVEHIKCGWRYENCCSNYETNSMDEKELLKKSCLHITEIMDYLGKGGKTISNIVGYAIHISKLEIFDKPKELNEFYGYNDKKVERHIGLPKVRVLTPLTKAPQSWQYIEVK